MFGAVTAYLYDYLLGIRAKDGSAAYSEITVSPVLVDGVNKAEGYRTFSSGKLSVSYVKTENEVAFDINVPENQPAELVFGDKKIKLSAGENKHIFTFE
jgi:hypothetical protein